MARIAPTTVPAHQALTVNLNPDPELTSRTTTLISAAAGQTVTTAADSVAASHVLAQLQQMRRWVSGIYRDAKAPLGTAKKTLDAQEKALLGPLREAEQQLMAAIVAFQAQETAARMKADAVALDAQLAGHDSVSLVRAPVGATTMAGMQSRTTFAAEVLDLRGLVLAVAAQLLLEVPGSTKVTQRWLTEVCQPTPQATLDLLQVVPAALNRTARALNTDLAIPGVVVASTTTLVAP